MNKIFNFLKMKWRLTILAVVLFAVMGLGIRLSSGPIGLDSFKQILISRIEKSLPGVKADIKHLDLVWFNDSNSLGFRIEDIVLKDKSNRIIASSQHTEAALAFESLLLFHFAPSRLTADNFFIVASVSNGGRYELGYDAKGKSDEIGGLDQVFFDLVGPEKLGVPISFTRKFKLSHGKIKLRQNGSRLDWVGRVDNINFTKKRGKIQASFDLNILSNGHASQLKAKANALIGLKEASIEAHINNLNPSEIFASVGVTQPIARLNAPVSGRANITYKAKEGFEKGYLNITVAKGQYGFDDFAQKFESMKIVASYLPKSKKIFFEKFVLLSKMIEADLFGSVQIKSHNSQTKSPLRIDFDFFGPRVTGKLADDFNSQSLTKVHLIGKFTPAIRQLEITKGTGFLSTSPVETKGRVWSDAKGQIGADLTASVKGDFSKEQVFVFWPEALSPITRSTLISRIKGGVFSNARFILKAPPGHLTETDLTNDDLRLDFDFREMSLEFDSRMRDASQLRGKATLLGNRFDLSLVSGQLSKVNLTSGAIIVPSFQDKRSKTSIWLDGEGQAVDIIAAVDPLTDGSLVEHGLDKSRLSGVAKVIVKIDFPTFEEIPNQNFNAHYEAVIHEAGLKKAALGWDLQHGKLTVVGDLLQNLFSIKGEGDLGPYKGIINFQSTFVPEVQTIDFDGSFLAENYGGSPIKRVPIKGHFVIENNHGDGNILSSIFEGKLSWSGENSEPNHIDLDGNFISKGFIDQGIPIFSRLKHKIPAQLSLARSGEIWSGGLQAGSLSGDIAYIEGAQPRLVYKASISPSEAHEFGWGGLPIFNVRRQLVVNIGLDDKNREALINLDQLQAVLGWSQHLDGQEPNRTLKMRLTPEDWAILGLPKSYFVPKSVFNVDGKWRQERDQTQGVIELTSDMSHNRFEFNFPLQNSGLNENLALEAQNAQDQTKRLVAQFYGPIDQDLLLQLGYNDEKFKIKGVIDLGFSLFASDKNFSAILNLDGSKSQLALQDTLWSKPLGDEASLAMSFDEGNDGQGVNITRIYGHGQGIDIEGRAAIGQTGRLEFADFSKIYLKDLANLNLKFYQDTNNQQRVFSLSGELLDIRPWLSQLGSQNLTLSSQKNTDVISTIKTHIVIDLKQLRTAIHPFSDVLFDGVIEGKNSIKAKASAKSANGAQLSFEASPISTPKGIISEFHLKSDDFGDAVSTALDIKMIHAGTATIDGYYSQNQTDFLIHARNIKAKQIPALAQLLSVASLTGLADTMTGEGIAFKEVYLPIRFKDGVSYIKNGWAKGAALGLNIHGTQTKDGQYDFVGVLIPAYTLNSMFGDLNANGEGWVGINYQLTGNFKQPQVMVNPLSVILPGFVRKWFEEDRADKIEPLYLPQEKMTKAMKTIKFIEPTVN